MNNLAPMKNCPGGVQGNLNWMPGYKYFLFGFEKVLQSWKLIIFKSSRFNCLFWNISITTPSIITSLLGSPLVGVTSHLKLFIHFRTIGITTDCATSWETVLSHCKHITKVLSVHPTILVRICSIRESPPQLQESNHGAGVCKQHYA